MTKKKTKIAGRETEQKRYDVKTIEILCPNSSVQNIELFYFYLNLNQF